MGLQRVKHGWAPKDTHFTYLHLFFNWIVFVFYWVVWVLHIFAWKWKVKVTQSCPTLCDPMDNTVHGILQAILEWAAFPFSGGSSQPRDWTQVSRIAGGFFYPLSHKGVHTCKNVAAQFSQHHLLARQFFSTVHSWLLSHKSVDHIFASLVA